MNDQMIKAAAETGTPAYIFSEAEFVQRAELVREAFGENVGLCYSIKANPFLLPILPQVFRHVEVCSPGELRICQALGIRPEMIIFSGVNKSYQNVTDAVRYGAGVLTAESLQHFRHILRAAEEFHVVPDVLIRLTAGSQFGMDLPEVLRLFTEYGDDPRVHICGIHYFSGTQKRKPKEVIGELEMLSELCDRIQTETGKNAERIEYGTGLSVDYFRNDADETEAQRLADIAPAIRALGEKAHLTVEMGRFFAAPCGYYLSRVADVKTNCGIRYAILDGGLHQLKYDGQLQGMQVPEITHLRPQQEEVLVIPAPQQEEPEQWTLCGSLCTTADVIARNAPLADLQGNDVLVFHRTGAYSVMEGMAVFLSRDMPSVWLLKADGSLCKVREAMDIWQMNLPDLRL